jgi:solute carrier family 35 protein F1/2
MGMWGVIINGIQAAALEHKAIKTGPWDAHTIGYLAIYTVSMFILYSESTCNHSSELCLHPSAVAPILYRMASSTYFNISILSSDFYGLVIGVFLPRFCASVLTVFFQAFSSL